MVVLNQRVEDRVEERVEEVINLKKIKIVNLQTNYQVKKKENKIRNSVVYLLDLH